MRLENRYLGEGREEFPSLVSFFYKIFSKLIKESKMTFICANIVTEFFWMYIRNRGRTATVSLTDPVFMDIFFLIYKYI